MNIIMVMLNAYVDGSVTEFNIFVSGEEAQQAL